MSDPADEAGGEVIFSSDGLSPVAVTKPPAVSQATTTDGETILDSDELAPETAFEVFQGKVYSAQGVNKFVPKSNEDETPLEKLARLSTEVAELETQLKSTASTSGKDFDEQLVGLASDLNTRLQTASSNKMEHDDLTRLMKQQLDSIKQQEGSAPAAAAAASTTGKTGVVYELYGTASNPTSTMETRIVKLERLLGSSQNQVTHNSLVSRLEELESLVQTVDPTILESTATKAKVIRADLEAASKAKNKLTATYKKEDSKMIQQLHQQMVELEGLSGYLPSLVERLQQLSGLHVQASFFSSRLGEVEKSAHQIGSTLTVLEESLDKVQTNMVDNVQSMETNMKSLDERLNKL
mmetsp:Transcript_37451/g.90857  ORF Transcript_37451/g.90857 Transcript_37451/m.90857 type:complete len:353 (+) Transcript_37451:98-1156(+)|eukprot:CAMPEP_0113625654 /NCGR_PEP_ID=MMETSP0017_2-20120614/13254_1 /TAXON_ID=2856 /ORGANISM="Cylindrotheca closterium" /LENGTH=352 /DNA_ID=CAMNT_0000535781 /DNA_START=90 /DNA_END=1148 /DNA_ORIENTATION=+ /assembly_acc=CAM_ASM_000147